MRRALVTLLATACMALGALLPSTAAAATWTAQAEACGGYNTSERGSGQMDSYGRMYMPCSQSARPDGSLYHDNYVAILDVNGNRTQRVPLDFTPDDGKTSTDRAADVAPSPDGSFVYVIKYANYTAYRFDRQGDGSYRLNAGWSLQRYPGAGGGAAAYSPLGQFLATDGNGDIYFSSGLWACNVGCTDDAIVKYRPDGTYVTRFGQKVGGSWALGHSSGSFAGLAVTDNGCRVFVTDVNNSRVQRFDSATYDGRGRCPAAAGQAYGAVLSIGTTQYEEPGCSFDRPGVQPDLLAAPYDVSLSSRGELLVLNTTCFNDGRYAGVPYGTIEVQRFDQNGNHRGGIVSRSLAYDRVHGIAVDHAGNIHLAQAKAVLRPAAGWSDAGADAGGGGPMGGVAKADATAPVITAFTAPATTQANAITLQLSATDASGVTHLRITEDGAQGAWQAYATSVAHVLQDRVGAHVLQLEVRDSVGNVSAAARATVTKVAPPAPAPAPNPDPKPAPAPNQPKPTPPAAGGNGNATGGGGGGDANEPSLPRPKITGTTIPVQVFRGRRISVAVRATGASRVTHVRFSTAGRWSTWQPVSGRRSLLLPRGVGWTGVLVQVRDSAGTRSVPWFQPVLMGPRGTQWVKGTGGRNALRLGAGSQHVDLSSFDSTVDAVSCGAGYDTVYAQPEDRVARDCERVVRVKLPAF